MVLFAAARYYIVKEYKFAASATGIGEGLSIMSSPFIPVILLASFAFLPTLILLLAYDIVVTDVETRTICYSLLRATRAQLFLGKLFSQSILLLLLNTLMLVLLLFMSLNMIGTANTSQTVLGIFRVWLCLIPYGLCYLSMILFASSMSNKREIGLPWGQVNGILVCSRSEINLRI